jgi:hypothetical protein
MKIFSTVHAVCAAAMCALILMVPPVHAQGNPPSGGKPHAPPPKPSGVNPKPAAPGPGVHAPAPHPLPQHPAPSFHRDARVGIYLGAPLYPGPWWYAPDPFYPYYPYAPSPYYYAPAPHVYEQPPVYIEQPVPQPQYWYYCEASRTYYPYVQTCATPWLRVVPHAPQ